MLSFSHLMDEADGAGDLRVAVDVVQELLGLAELPLGDDVRRLEHVLAPGPDRVAGLVIEQGAGAASVGEWVTRLKCCNLISVICKLIQAQT